MNLWGSGLKHNISSILVLSVVVLVMGFQVSCGSNSQSDSEDVSNGPNGSQPTPTPAYIAPKKLEIITAQNSIQANGDSRSPAVSDDGQFVVFESSASNLVSSDNNGDSDIFLFDRQSQTMILVSKNSQGQSANGRSLQPSLSSNGQFVVFMSEATDLVENDNNNSLDVFIYNRETDLVSRVSQTSAGVEGNNISQEARVNGAGTYVVFQSFSDNFVAGDNNGFPDIFRYEVASKELVRVSIASDSSEPQGNTANPDIDDSGNLVVFMSQSNNFGCINSGFSNQIVMRNMNTGDLICVSQSNGGAEGNSESSFSKISSDGNLVSFVSDSNNLVASDVNSQMDMFIYDVGFSFLNSPTSGNLANGSSDFPSVGLSNDKVIFQSNASNLTGLDVDTEFDIYSYNIADGSFNLLSIDENGIKSDADAEFPSVSRNHQHVVFISKSRSFDDSRLTGTYSHIFVRPLSFD